MRGGLQTSINRISPGLFFQAEECRDFRLVSQVAKLLINESVLLEAMDFLAAW